MKLILREDYGYVPEVSIRWADIAEMHSVAKTVKKVLSNHKESKNNSKVKPIYLDDDDLKQIYSILFRLTHSSEIYENENGEASIKYRPIIEDENFNVEDYI